MNINPYSNYLNLNTNTATNAKTTDNEPEKKNTQSTQNTKSTNIDNVTLSNIDAESYLKKYSNLNYNVLDASEAFPDWYANGVNNGFPLQELFTTGVTETSSGSYNINAIPDNSHAVFIPPALQEKMDNNPELAAQVIKKIEDFMQGQQMLAGAPGLSDMGVNITGTSSILSFDENGEIATWNIVVDCEIETPEDISSFEIATETNTTQIEVSDSNGNKITYKSVSTKISISASHYEGLNQLQKQLVLTFNGDLIDLNTRTMIRPATDKE